MLFISAVIIVALFVVNFVFFNEKKGVDIYVRDSDGNYVLDNYGKAITKQQECYENRKTGAAIGYDDTTGYCTLDGKWVDKK